MQDDISPQPFAAARRPGSAKTVLLATLLAFLAGGLLVGWLAWEGKFAALMPETAPVAAPARLATAAQPGTGQQALPVGQALGSVETRLALLEDRLSRIDLQAHAASGNAARAEGLLIAFAARRLIDRGAQLGYLEDQLRLRFADAQPNAVQTVIAASRQPVTLEELASQLEAAGPALSQAPSQEGAWDRMKREISGLFVIRHETTPSPAPQSRVERARLLLTSGKTEAAIAEVARLPGAAGAQGWIASARRYEAAQRALDLIETTAMLEPHRLQDGSGNRVNQPSPLIAPPVPKPEA